MIPSAPAYPAAFTSTATEWLYGTAPACLGDLVLNAVDGDGVYWILEHDFEGWGSPGSTLVLDQKARGHGSTANEPFLRSRVLSGHVVIDAPTTALARRALDRFYAAASLQETLLAVREDVARHVTVQRQDELIPTWLGPTVVRVSFQLSAKDPLKYGDLETYSTSLPSTSGGRTYPISYVTTYTGVTASGILTVTNPGNEHAPVWLRVDGPVPAGGWSVTHLGRKRSLTFATSLALAAGEFVTVDMQSREVLAQGQPLATRSGWVTSRGWFDLDPGPNEIAFSAAVYDKDARLTLQTMPAWS